MFPVFKFRYHHSITFKLDPALFIFNVVIRLDLLTDLVLGVGKLSNNCPCPLRELPIQLLSMNRVHDLIHVLICMCAIS